MSITATRASASTEQRQLQPVHVWMDTQRKVVDSPGYFLIEGKQVSVAMTDNETESLTITHTPRTDSKRGVIQVMRLAVEGAGTIITSKNWSCMMVESLCTENYITVPLVMSSTDCFLPARVSNVRS